MSSVNARPPATEIAAIAIAAVAVVAFGVQVALPASSRLTNGFSAYYTAARLVVQGADPARFYDDAWFSSQTIRLGFGAAQDIYNVNPPATALLLLPLAGFDPVTAKEFWTALNLVFLGVALMILARLGGWSPVICSAAVILVTAFQPVQEEIKLGQAYALLLVLEALLARAYLNRRNGFVGGVLAVLLGFKAAGLTLPALLIAQRQWRALVATAITLLAIVGLTIPILGWLAWSTYTRLLFDFGGHPEIAVTAYQSVPSVLFHLFRYDPVWNTAPLVDLPLAAAILVILVEIALVAITFAITARPALRSRSDCSVSFAAWAILSIIGSPASADYHYTLLLVPIALLAGHWYEFDRRPLY
ncbi:MAG TPA: glycosyltransferase family 87 protein, partial [Chloroflexota bacterium]|nr:glycosyltransferase family 87 protein [Chloroflexota bacterium]